MLRLKKNKLMHNELKKYIQDATSILITAHIGPDADSLCSSLLLKEILKINFPDKKVTICMEEEYETLDFLDNYETIEFAPLATALANHRPELLVILDGNNVARCSRNPEPAQKFIVDNKITTVIIDHHEPIGIEPGAVYINRKSPAVTQDIYEIFFIELGLHRPANYAQTAMIGLYSDTGGFTYDNPRNKDTFRMASELIEDGASAELAANQLTQYSHEGLEALGELIKNIHQTKDCTYTYISDAVS